MQKYRISLSGSYSGAMDIEATTPAFAIKRVLDGGAGAGYKFASVDWDHPEKRVKLAKGQAVTIRCERIG